MDQYFSRIKELSKNEKLPARIRFMLQDVLELRNNHWLPRQTISAKESPKPIEDIRREAQDELGITDGSRSPADDFRYLQIGGKAIGYV
jgi:translation initiation factor 4G